MLRTHGWLAVANEVKRLQVEDPDIKIGLGTYRVLLDAYREGEQWDKVLALFSSIRDKAKELSTSMQERDYANAIIAAGKLGKHDLVHTLWKELVATVTQLSADSYNALLHACTELPEEKRLDAALAAFRELKLTFAKSPHCKPDQKTFHILANAAQRLPTADEASAFIHRVYTEMNADRTLLGSSPFFQLASACLQHQHLFRKGIEILHSEADCGHMPSVSLYNTAVATLVRQRAKDEEVLELIARMQKAKVRPTMDTFIPLLARYFSQNNIDKVLSLVGGEMKQAGIAAATEILDKALEKCKPAREGICEEAVAAAVKALEVLKVLVQYGAVPGETTARLLIELREQLPMPAHKALAEEITAKCRIILHDIVMQRQTAKEEAIAATKIARKVLPPK